MYLRLSPYQEILQGVITSLQVNEGIIKITGKSGAGKTALCSQLFHELEGNGQPAVFFLKPPASAVALQNDILDNLNLDPTGNFTRTLTNYLVAKTTREKPLVLIFDDAQHLDAQTFSAIRMLCNIEDNARSMVRVILCGTEELDEKLAKPALRAVTQFLNQSFTLPYLTQEQVNDFCQGYWMLTGEEMRPMSESTQKKLFQETQGHPGILQARLNQGTTGAEKSERHSREDGAAPVKSRPYRYSGRRQGWAPALLTVAALAALGGGGAYIFLGPAEVAETAPMASPSGSTQDAPEPAAAPVETTVANAAPPLAEPAAAPVSEPAVVAAPVAAVLVSEEVAVDVEAASAEVPAGASTSEPVVDAAAPAADVIEALPTEPVAEEPKPEQIAPAAVAGETPPSESAATSPVVTAVAVPPVEEFISSWTASWQNKDVDAYLAAYHPDFTPPQGATREAWEQQRRRVITNAVDIMVSADAPESIREAQDGMRLVRFWLNYSAANYADRTLKELLLAPVDGAWRIRIETNLRTERL